jgi:hypothetical protein
MRFCPKSNRPVDAWLSSGGLWSSCLSLQAVTMMLLLMMLMLAAAVTSIDLWVGWWWLVLF